MIDQSQWGEGMPYTTRDAYLTRPISRAEWMLSGKEEKQERSEAKSRMAVVLRKCPETRTSSAPRKPPASKTPPP